jgi:regulator of protease activity HflC (stomatin/prohibitin superfamily)
MLYSIQVNAVTGSGKTMTSIAIHIEDSKADTPRFRAVAGNRQAVGRTMGEALDSLTADWGDDIQETAVFIQRFEPDAYFTAAQYHRMQELLARRATLTAEERGELEALIDTELEATITRTEGLLRPRQP